ncbi:hypothetical protein HZ994_11305 [Akkermansiaceae bacterium]|nr:hypothetical protein HZ994_11305 [Akkermansiaceae bacterium]
MNDTPNNTAETVSVEEMVSVSLCNVKQRLRNRRTKCEDRIRESPAASVLGAVGVGYLLHRMPVRAILVTQVRILSALAPPALFLFGAAKLISFLQRQQPADRK